MRVVVWPDGTIYEDFRASYPGLAGPWDPTVDEERPRPKVVDLDELALGRMLCAGTFDFQLTHGATERHRGQASHAPTVLLVARKGRGFRQM